LIRISSTTPENVDVCGENGEFHTFTFDGPIFSKPIDFEIGEIVYRKYENQRGFLKHGL
jgi:diphthamide synthase (EF-2-diphthine--ammonia ligase)